jgi:hypothetical protein
MVLTPKIERMDDFLSDDNVRRDVPILNESRLGIVKPWKMRFKYVR